MKGKEKKRTEDDIGPTRHVGEVKYHDKPKDCKCETEGQEQKSHHCPCLIGIANVIYEMAHGFLLLLLCQFHSAAVWIWISGSLAWYRCTSLSEVEKRPRVPEVKRVSPEGRTRSRREA